MDIELKELLKKVLELATDMLKVARDMDADQMKQSVVLRDKNTAERFEVTVVIRKVEKDA